MQGGFVFYYTLPGKKVLYLSKQNRHDICQRLLKLRTAFGLLASVSPCTWYQCTVLQGTWYLHFINDLLIIIIKRETSLIKLRMNTWLSFEWRLSCYWGALINSINWLTGGYAINCCRLNWTLIWNFTTRSGRARKWENANYATSSSLSRLCIVFTCASTTG